MACAANGWFPIPFAAIVMAPASYVISIASFCAVVGMPAAREILKDRDRLVRFGSFVATQQSSMLIYPAYQALFHATVNTNCKLLVTLLLPVIKRVVKNIALRCVTHMEDMMPEIVIFTVDFLNALYLATSMETARSFSTVGLIILIDVMQSTMVLLSLQCTFRGTSAEPSAIIW